MTKPVVPGIHRKKSSNVLGHRTNRRVVGGERRDGAHRRALDELADGLIAKVLVRVCLGHGRQDALPWMSSGQGEDALNEANGADATRGERRVGPLLDRRADALTLTDEPIDKRLLTARGFGLPARGANTPAATRA